MRSVKEWIATHDDQAIPDRVKLRIWIREGGRCHLTRKQIRPGDKYQFEHKKSLAHGGEHRESNIFLALDAPHKIKSAEERRQQAKSDRIRKRHLGFKPKGRKIPYRKFDGTPVDPNRRPA